MSFIHVVYTPEHPEVRRTTPRLAELKNKKGGKGLNKGIETGSVDDQEGVGQFIA